MISVENLRKRWLKGMSVDAYCKCLLMQLEEYRSHGGEDRLKVLKVGIIELLGYAIECNGFGNQYGYSAHVAPKNLYLALKQSGLRIGQANTMGEQELINMLHKELSYFCSNRELEQVLRIASLLCSLESITDKR